MAVIALSMLLVCVPQDPAGASGQSGSLGVQLDARGWPVLQQAPARPGIDSWPPAAVGETPPVPSASGTTPSAAPVPIQPAPASGLGLAPVFAQLQSPAAFARLGAVKVWWRLTVYGERGRVGQRELTHVADLQAAARDRLEYEDGRVLGRIGGTVFAERHGRPWPVLATQGAPELELFGLQLRMPWIFADRGRFAEAGVSRPAESDGAVQRLLFQRRTRRETLGPLPEAQQVDRFELLTQVGGLPVELVHQFRCSGERRRVQLDDWRSVEGVRMPFRRTYVDAMGRPTTVLEVLRIEPMGHLPLGVFRLEMPSVPRRYTGDLPTVSASPLR
ncbi:MAG: hypothetical protein VYE77_03155 [Planctomycetota bacterium]|nr:hypothetical protein [Planctomycetota bacterium]